jgi:hypothetical protein
MRPAALIGLGSLAIMLAGSPATSSEPVTTTYLLSMQMHDGDRLVASPRLTIAAGKPAKIEIGDAAGNHYDMTITATAQSSETVAIKSTINVVSGGVHQTASPSMLIGFNKPSSIAFGVDSATSKPFRVELTINKPS